MESAGKEQSVAPATGAPTATDTSIASRDEVRAHIGWAVATLGLLLSIFWVLRNIPAIGWPLLLAAIVAYLCDPIVDWAAGKGVSRTVGTGVIILTGVVVAIVVVARGVPLVVEQGRNLPEDTVIAADKIIDHLTALSPSLLKDTSVPRDLEHARAFLQEHLKDIVQQVLPKAGGILSTIAAGSLSVLSFVLSALVVPVVGFFLLRDWPKLITAVDGLVPAKQRPFVRLRMGEIDRVLSGFVRGQLTMAGVLSLLYSVALSVIGLKVAVVVGLATGFGNLVPYVGTSTGVLLSVGFCLVDFGADYHLAMVLGTFALLVATDSLFITPRVVGPRVGLSPAAVIVSVLTCGSLFGFGGVLLAVPSAAVLKVVVRNLMSTWQRSRTFKEG